MSTYPLFMPPDELAEKGAKNWNKKEAKIYLDWFLNEKEVRVNHLLSFLEYKLTGDHAKDLTIVSEFLYNKINNPQFYNLLCC